MDGIVENKSSLKKWVVHITVALIIVVWLTPTLGLFVSSFRTRVQISVSGWWTAFFTTEQNEVLRAADPDDFRLADGDVFTVSGNLFGEGSSKKIILWGTKLRTSDAYVPGEMADMGEGESITVQANGDYVWRGNDDQLSGRGQRVFATVRAPPEFTLQNYHWMLFDKTNPHSLWQALLNTLIMAIPSTIIPIVMAAFAAYALAWMNFRGRGLLIAAVVAGLAVPPNIALIPVLKLHMDIGIGKSYLGMWLAHSAFTLPFALFLLRNYMAGIPREIVENAKLDGANDFQIFTRIILPLSIPALASYAIIQFLWVFNDLLGPKVFLIDSGTGERDIITNAITRMLGPYAGNWDIISAGAFISMAVPLAVFFAMQRYFARGLLAGSIKG
tara:strand:- start:266 stop:1426 length:1161 start_codon:yes stop_codon:yes gene_type:complete